MEPDYKKLSIEELAKLGDVALHNIGANFFVLEFMPRLKGVKYQGEGKTIALATANLKPSSKTK